MNFKQRIRESMSAISVVIFSVIFLAGILFMFAFGLYTKNIGFTLLLGIGLVFGFSGVMTITDKIEKKLNIPEWFYEPKTLWKIKNGGG